jgi:uncharacterized protein
VEPEASNLLFALSAAFDVLVVCGALALALRGGASLGRVALACLGAGAVLALKGAVLAREWLDGFGIAHVLWLDLVVVVPLAGVTALVLLRGRRARALKLAAVMALCLAPVGAYASFVEPERLVTERATVPLDAVRAGERPLRVGVMSDLQFEVLGDHEREAIDRLLSLRPDVILIAGDFHQGESETLERQLPGLRRLLSRLRAPGGVFAVQGDAEGLNEAHRVVEGTGVRLLVNEEARVRVRDRRLTIGGLQLAYWSERAGRAARRFEARRGRRDVRILLAHRPDAVRLLRPDTRVDLTVAGHTHGGQIQVPGFGALTDASIVPREIGSGGLHSLDGRRIYVTRGVGVERGQAPRVRFGAPPEVSLLTLR